MDYRGRLKAMIFDWAGTTVDFGSRAPVGAFVRTFEQFGISLTEQEARGSTGVAKRDHTRALLQLPRVADEWQRVHGRPFTDGDVDALYEAFVPLSSSGVLEHADVIPGVTALIDGLRQRGVAIGSTTRYSRQILEAPIPRAAALGFSAQRGSPCFSQRALSVAFQ